MDKYKLLLCCCFLLMLGYNTFSQSLITTKGTVELIYTKDTTGYNRYWLTHKRLYNDENSFFLIKDIGDVIGQMVLECSGTEKFQYNLKNRKRLYDLEQYSVQGSTDENDYYTHIGGDVYRFGEDQLVISFDVEIRGFVLESPPCQNFRFESSYSCPVLKKNESYPLLIIVDVISAKSLDRDFLSKKGYRPYEFNKFAFGECD